MKRRRQQARVVASAAKKSAYLTDLSDSIMLGKFETDEIRTATAFISNALRSWFKELIEGSHIAHLTQAELAEFIIDSSAVQLMSNLLSPSLLAKIAEDNGTVKAAHVFVNNFKEIIAARDRALQIASTAAFRSPAIN